MFKLIGVAVAIYTVYAFVKGEVYARSFVMGRKVTRAEDENYFLTVIAIYGLLSVGLMTFL
ncbi:hypothetical protein NMQ14_07405 [Methyloversatilis sp. XJ19-13]|uniref:hypothetical protein n=1 Tax=Methyloversatilis sp. XJ19-13 TaxID=2963430 RepID=UPI00211C2B22|nr:hypothetical protein [Methyloversatilis sp. XJ19-13]MCQ9374070.1 hypothetical protein [Methyloversatilis sp. XJ19-13]